MFILGVIFALSCLISGNVLADEWEEEEMEEGNDSDGSWVDVSHSEDEGEVSLFPPCQ